jgi:Transposase DDE domain
MRQPSPSKHNKELSDETTRAATVARLQEHLTLEIAGRKATTEMALEVLVHAATTGQSIEASCADLERSADSNTLRDYLNQAFVVAGLAQLEDEVNAALTAKLPKKVGKHKRELAIDLHDQPFYGKDEGLLSYASRGQAKAGTTYFYRIASVYLILDGLRFTLGVVFVRSEMSLADCVAALLARVKAQSIRVSCLYLDRGFAALEVYDYLQEQHIPAVIACPIRGKQAGTKALCRGRKSYTTQHTFRSQTQGERTHTIAVVRAYTQTGQRNRPKQRRARWFLYVLIHVQLSPQAVHARYRYRFGIESSYRLLRQVRVYTNSRNPALRFLFMALALILLTMWLCLRFHFCQQPRQGRQGRSLDEAGFRLHCFAAFLRRAIERRYGVRQTIEATVLPRGV